MPSKYTPKSRRTPPNFDHVVDVDWARLAVLIDGEGNIGLNKQTRKSKSGFAIRAVVEITNTDPRMMKWLVDTFGGRVTFKDGRKQSRNFICFRWQVSSTAAFVILRGCLPFFLIKREQAQTLLAFQETVLENRGRAGNPESVLLIQKQLRHQLRNQKTENLWPMDLYDDVQDAQQLLC